MSKATIWETKSLRTLSSKIGSGITPRGGKKSYLSEGIPLIRSQNVLVGSLELTDVAFISVEQHNSMSSTKLKANDVLLNITGASIGRSCVFPSHVGEANVNQHVCIIRTKPSLNAHFLSTFLNSYEGQKLIFSYQAGGNREGLNFEQIASFPIPLPPLPEQRKIANILGAWDEEIRLTERLTSAKQTYKKGLMQQLLTGKMRFPGFEGSKGTIKSKFGDLPADWSISALGQLIKPVSRLNKVKRNQKYQLIGVRLYGEGVHVHTIIDGNEIKTSALNQIHEGDILYNKMWTTKGAFAVAKSEYHGTYGTSEYPTFQADLTVLTTRYFDYIFRHPRFHYDAITLCRGTTERARLNPKDFLKLEIPLPPLAEQHKIADVLEACDQEITLLQRKAVALREQKKGLMQQLLTGKVRVNV